MNFFIGCDLGGTNLRAGIVDVDSGEVTQLTSIPTQARDGHAAVMERMAGLFEGIIQASGLSKDQIGGIGIGVPGNIDLERGEVLFLPNLQGHWQNVPLAQRIHDLSGLPVSILNDVRAITYGEWKFGAGRGVGDLVCVAVGTGVGGGLVLDNRLHLGLGGLAGEFGHQTVEIEGPRCGCGNRGCLELYASGPAIASLGIKAVVHGHTTRIGELVDFDLNRITAKVVYQAAQEGDVFALDIFASAGRYLGIAIANLLLAVAPHRVVIAGGVARAGDLLLEPIRRTVHERVFILPVEQVEIVTGKLENNAGVIGTAIWAKDQLGEKPQTR